MDGCLNTFRSNEGEGGDGMNKNAEEKQGVVAVLLLSLSNTASLRSYAISRTASTVILLISGREDWREDRVIARM